MLVYVLHHMIHIGEDWENIQINRDGIFLSPYKL